MTTTKQKTFKSAFSDAYPYGNEAIQKVFEEFKNLFKVKEAFKRNGVLLERLEYWTNGPTYYIILINGKVEHFESGYISGRLNDTWQNLVRYKYDQYINGCPHYSIENANEVEIIKTENRFIEFHKIAKRSMPGSPIRAKYDKIDGTPFMIGKSVMYRYNEQGQPEFFYEKNYSVRSYDFEYNLKNNHRFNTKFTTIFSINSNNATPTQALNALIKDLEKTKEKYTIGYWSDSPSVWNEPNPALEAKIQAQIEAVKKFQLTYEVK